MTEGRAGFAGLVTCGSVWVCPVCSAKVMARRALEIGTVVAAATAEDMPVAFGTFTVRHNRRQPLATVWDGVAAGWKRVRTGKSWTTAVERFGIEGYCRVQEVTFGVNGWHPHVHSLFIGSGLNSDAEVERFFMPTWKRWAAGAQSVGLEAPLPRGSEWHLVNGGHLSGTALGEYLSKGYDAAAAIGMEMTQTQSKVAQGVHKTRPTWELMQGAINGEVRPLRLWWEWEQASKGRRQIAWSRGVRERFGLVEVEKSDDEIAAEAIGTERDALVHITRDGWGQLVHEPALIPQVLEVAEQTGQAGLSKWLIDHGIEHRRV